MCLKSARTVPYVPKEMWECIHAHLDAASSFSLLLTCSTMCAIVRGSIVKVCLPWSKNLSCASWPDRLERLNVRGGFASHVQGVFSSKQCVENMVWPERLSELTLYNCPIAFGISTPWPKGLRVLDLTLSNLRPYGLGQVAWPSTLVDLCLSHNFLSDQTISIIQNLPSTLNRLDLTCNFINTHHICVPFPEGLRKLILSNNHGLSQLSGVHFPTGLLELALFDCYISDLSKVSFPDSLTLLDVGNNYLRHSIHLIRWPKALKTLDLYNNFLEDETFHKTRWPEALTDLDVSCNQLECPSVDRLPDSLLKLDMFRNHLRDSVIHKRWPTGLRMLILKCNQVSVNIEDVRKHFGNEIEFFLH